MADLNQISSYDYTLPEELIAQSPAPHRTDSRLLVFDRSSGAKTHRHFRDLLEFVRPGDCLVLNRTRVVPARLRGFRDQTGGKWEGLFLRLDADNSWILIGRTKGKLQLGETVTVHSEDQQSKLQLKFLECDEQGTWRVQPVLNDGDTATAWELLDRVGAIPLPPYIQHGKAAPEDRERYQTVYASTPGAVAAPTAGLHFTPELLDRCRESGVGIAEVTLHVGLGTFRPIAVENLDEHEMHSEWCEVSEETVNKLAETRASGGRVIAVGTTTVRTLETAAQSGSLQPWQGESTLFIRPGFEFHAIDGMITNFHLPKSSLLVMLSAFTGYEQIMACYAEAIREQYRFYSYGDAMLIV
ncbi:tRNA preQ1(34) S-adenosylmethionine ribosyltransferase-isomerase QueA [Rubinisphaera margarita]|uniref:tRNA preQ1(34) S-adenosylmethionine ribosyltransferase-isomerase QueA n=1 Tax=Rubinisphaera margarita TaxID=2909586 RepID=UPI001EE7939A|nr:tRNA preQ1(34) S-adenosylmethionine ribosyltransferase-isomerase QueA [Rubinisphaera margarita]MCG6154302.1 tRNA preQ1(34) S-adenosylmethionine ribosyltransferase-isomerase QueA [Rubinisphaera margarita]